MVLLNASVLVDAPKQVKRAGSDIWRWRRRGCVAVEASEKVGMAGSRTRSAILRRAAIRSSPRLRTAVTPPSELQPLAVITAVQLLSRHRGGCSFSLSVPSWESAAEETFALDDGPNPRSMQYSDAFFRRIGRLSRRSTPVLDTRLFEPVVGPEGFEAVPILEQYRRSRSASRNRGGRSSCERGDSAFGSVLPAIVKTGKLGHSHDPSRRCCTDKLNGVEAQRS